MDDLRWALTTIGRAWHVCAVEKSNNMQLVQRIVRDNRLAKTIAIVQGKAVDINLPIDTVDIIISRFFV